MEDIYNEPIYSKNVLEFIRVAHEYCLFIEKGNEHSSHEFFEFMQRVGPLLYLKGSLLPEVTVEYPEANERFVTEEEYENVFNELRGIFDIQDIHWQVDHEYDPADALVKVSLGENLADIYQDLKDFLLLYQKNSRAAKENAVHDCKDFFISRWGPKLLNSIKYIHFLLYQDRPLENSNWP